MAGLANELSVMWYYSVAERGRTTVKLSQVLRINRIDLMAEDVWRSYVHYDEVRRIIVIFDTVRNSNFA